MGSRPGPIGSGQNFSLNTDVAGNVSSIGEPAGKAILVNFVFSAANTPLITT
jgi:hypothetical protein